MSLYRMIVVAALALLPCQPGRTQTASDYKDVTRWERATWRFLVDHAPST